MKLAAPNDENQAAMSSTFLRAFTLPEMMVTMAILFLTIVGILYCHLFGVRMFEITKAKLGALAMILAGIICIGAGGR